MPLNKSWLEYNDSLIERGRVLMDIGFLRLWNKEIKEMNLEQQYQHQHQQLGA